MYIATTDIFIHFVFWVRRYNFGSVFARGFDHVSILYEIDSQNLISCHDKFEECAHSIANIKNPNVHS